MARVSVVMPVYNGEKYLREAIDSILAQTFTDWEFIIVNEFGSNAAATGILKEYAAKDARVRVLQNQTRLGIAESLNVGIRAGKGEYIARMDGDDISGPERLQKQVEYLDAHPDVGLLGIHPTVFGEEHWDWYTEYEPEQIAANALFFLPCLHPTVMMRKSVLEEHGLLYNPEYRCTEDYDLFERILQHTKAGNLDDQELFHYRRYPTAATYANLSKGIEIYQCVMKRAFERMGLAFSEEELRLLCIHLGCHGIKGKELLRKMGQLDLLMKRIMQVNMRERRIDMDALFKTLHKRWEHMWDSDILPGYGWEDVPQDIRNCYTRSIFSHETWAKKFRLTEDSVPTVTVLMPVHNGEKYLYESIKSIQDQTYTDWELLIVNDASTDDTVMVIEEYQKRDDRIRLLTNEQNLRIARTLNRGMLEARGKYIARMDDDDISLPTRIEKQVAIMESHPEISVVGTWQRHFGTNDWIHCPPETPAEMQAALLFKCEACHSTIMLRRDDFVQNELFYDPNFLSEDYELWTRASRTLKFYTIQEILGEYRLNGENITANKADLFNEEGQRIVARTLKEVLDLNIKKDDMVLLSGWKNPFIDSGGDKKQLREREEELLQKIEKQNEKYHAYDPAALKATLDQRREWAGIIKPTKQSKAAAPKKTIKQRLKGFIKRLLKPLYHPFRWRYEDRLLRIESSMSQLAESVRYLQKTLYDLDGHLYDYYDDLTQSIQRQDAQIKRLQAELGVAQAAVVASVDERVLKAEQVLAASADERIGKAEQALAESMDARIWKAEQVVTESTDARIWKAEQTLAAGTDERIWKAEQALTASTDARIWKAECLLRDEIVGHDQSEHILDETHRHIDFTYRDLMVALQQQRAFLPENDITLETKYPVAYESLDHLYPHGTIRDNTRYPRFVEKCETLLAPKTDLAFLDLGCSGGGMVLEAALRGHISMGLEGSDCSKKEQRAEWRLLGDRLQTCDITKPFCLRDAAGGVRQFDIITAWEVLEHIAETDLPGLFDNIKKHLADGGIFVGSIANWDDIDPESGVNWHVTVHPYDWWKAKFEAAGFRVCTELFDVIDLARGGYNPPHCYEAPYPETDTQKSFHIAVRKADA